MNGSTVLPAKADFFLSTRNGFVRYDDAGNLVHQESYLGESVDGMTLGPDGYLYVATNDLGIGSIYRFDPTLNEYVDGFGDDGSSPEPWLKGEYCLPCHPSSEPYHAPGPMTIGPSATQDIFAISTATPWDQQWLQRVLRIDAHSGSVQSMLDGVITPTTPAGTPQFVDIAAGVGRIDTSLYVALSNGAIHQYVVVEEFDFLIRSSDTGISIDAMAIGPKGNLFLRGGTDDSIFVFDPSEGMVVQTLVQSIPVMTNVDSGWRGDLFLGPNNDLFVINRSGYDGVTGERSDGHVLRFDRATGEYLGVALTVGPLSDFDGLERLGLYLVPEPGGASLITALIYALGSLRARTKARNEMH